MSEVYVLIHRDYDSTTIEGIFSRKETAQLLHKKLNSKDYFIKEFTLIEV